MEHKNTALAPAVMEIINQVSGTYSAPFWDGLLAVTESLDTVRAVKDTIEALHGEKKDTEAYRLILALHDLASIEVPTLKGIGMSLGISTNMADVTARYVDVRLDRKATVLEAYHNALFPKEAERIAQKKLASKERDKAR